MSSRSKNLITKELRNFDSSPEADTYVAAYKYRKMGDKNAYLILNDNSSNSTITAKVYRESYLKQAGSMTLEQAVAHILDCKLTRNAYQIARNTFIKMKNLGYPPFYRVLEAKKACYPNNLSIKGHCAEVPLQSLCNHTVERLCKYLDLILSQLSDVELTQLRLYFKYGSDGSSSQSNYKQKFVDENNHLIDDSSIYVSSLVPLQLVTIKVDGSIGKIVWENDKPSSPMYCRPIRIRYAKEATELILQEKNILEEQIANIQSHSFNILSSSVNVCFQFISTMYVM